MRGSYVLLSAGFGALAVSCGASAPSNAQTATTVHYSLPSEDLGTGLQVIAKLSGREIIFQPSDVAELVSKPVNGDFSAEDAVRLAIAGTGLRFDLDEGAIIIRARAYAANPKDETQSHFGDAIVVTGTRIRGAHVASPVITLSRQQMLDAAENDLGQVVRDIPQSFAGGQNPNVLPSAGGVRNDNLNSASTINLRGLGPDATLTLLNGHRLSYDGASQAVDVSSIPVAAVDRLEIVADGSSAIYGSDAVGGVANIILRRDYEGLQTDARLGGATEGGDFQQQYDVVAGKRWSSGGFIATYNFERDTEINAGQRPFTQNINYSTTLIPYQRQHSAVVSVHQQIGSDLYLSGDLTFNHRNSALGFALLRDVPYQDTGIEEAQSTSSFSVAPRLEWHAPNNWLVALSGVYGSDVTHFISIDTSGGSAYDQTPGRYHDTSKIVEISAEGPLTQLPAGELRLALGGGYRDIGLTSYAEYDAGGTSRTLVDNHHSRSSKYGYGEIFVPVVSPDLAIPALTRLEATGALRYESYGLLGSEATPKFGLIYAPVSDVTLKATWGMSFKTPTLYQQYSGYTVNLYTPEQLSASGAPVGSTVLIASGANPNLKSERATSWTAGGKFTPHWLAGLTIEASYFNIRYRGRINQVGLQLNGALSNPLYQELITHVPGQAAVDAIVAGADRPLTNNTGGVFDAGNVFAFIDDRFLNVSRQDIHGIDLALNYTKAFDGDRSINVIASASYLHSTERLVAGSTSRELSGVIYNPPKWRARGGGSWTDHGFTTAAFVNYVGPVTDNAEAPYRRVGSMTTVDATIRVVSAERAWLTRGLSMTLAISNILNAKPATIRVSYPLFPAYDSTNYSPVGRLISVTLSKRW